jgi:hypothetical protein
VSTHEGWKNFETWSVNLWIANDEALYLYWRKCARGAVAEGGRRSLMEYRLAERLKSEVSAQAPSVDGIWADLLSAALCEVDWQEIAADMLRSILAK